MTIKQFCYKHNACDEGWAWAVENCKDMHEVWQTAPPEWLIWVATRRGVLTDKELRLFAVFCARQVQHLLTDKRSLAVIDVAERYANGKATEEELAVASEVARSVRILSYAAYTAGGPSTCAVRAATQAAQAAWLRENTVPNFKL